MLFLLFVNDLSDVVQHCTVNLYADDTTIYSTDENPVVLGARMEKDLESVANWIKMNGLKMNVVKTQLMVLTRKGKYHMADDLEVKNTCLEKQNCVNYLGVKIDRDLSWRTHNDHLHRQCMANKKSKSLFTSECQKAAVSGFCLIPCGLLFHCMEPLFHCMEPLFHCMEPLWCYVERIQKYALRIIHGKPPRTSSEPLLKALGWTTLEKRRYKALVCLVHRCLSDEAPSFLCSSSDQTQLYRLHQN